MKSKQITFKDVNPYVFPLLDKLTQENLFQNNELNIYTEAIKVLNFTNEQIRSPKRNRPLSEARAIICHIFRQKTKLTLKEIGWTFLGGRDHTTVLNSLKIAKDLMDTDKSFIERYNKVVSHLKRKRIIS